MTRADRTAAAAAQRSTFELLCWCCSFWDIVGEQIWNIYLVNIHCFLTQECHHKKHMCRQAGLGRSRVNSKIVSFYCRKTDFNPHFCQLKKCIQFNISFGPKINFKIPKVNEEIESFILNNFRITVKWWEHLIAEEMTALIASWQATYNPGLSFN